MGSEGEPPNFPCFICEPHPLKKEIYALAQFKYFVINQLVRGAAVDSSFLPSDEAKVNPSRGKVLCVLENINTARF